MNSTTLILDSSVIAKWFFVENDTENALNIKDQFVDNLLSIVVPAILYYEINNVFKTSVSQRRIDSNEAKKAYNSFLKLNLISYSTELLLKNTLESAIKFDIPSYDASYIALAEYLQVPFITADKKLLVKVESKYIFDLKDYNS